MNNLRIGAIGLGVGTIASYCRPGDHLRFYEINPNVVTIASGLFFSYLRDCPAKPSVILGDARISMEQEIACHQSQRFDVLILDAFSDDAIPTHLLTKEAFGIYLSELKDKNSIIAVHISNQHLDLSPVVAAVADYYNLYGIEISQAGYSIGSSSSQWVLLSRSRQALSYPDMVKATTREMKDIPDRILWTDDFSNLFSVMKME